ncbi:MAG: DUF433 domain-containing protein, partial [Planctomycetia bacterium]
GVDFVLSLLAGEWTEEEILRNYPGLSHEDILACLAFASELSSQERVYAFPLRRVEDAIPGG